MEDRCGVSTTADFKTVSSRVESEGMSFLTISLASYGADLQKGLDCGYVDHDLFTGFRFRGGLPELFRGFLGLIFDTTSGRLLDNASSEAIQCLRQITLMWAKINLECSPKRNVQAILKYVQCEQDVRSADKRLHLFEEEFKQVSGVLYRDLFTACDLRIHKREILPKHGPGATADRLKGNFKYLNRQWNHRLEQVFPISENAFHSYSAFLAESDQIDILEPGAEIPVRVITVPKTLKTPRIIAIEPAHMQYMQQAILEMIVQEISAIDTVESLIGFQDQEPNRLLALEGSRTGELATLDMSEASDRVSNQHVRLLLHRFPSFMEAVDATRSRKADVPGHGVLRLAKFASMGSALCFPFEAMVFCTVIFVGISRALNRPLTHRDVKSLVGRVRIFGDDIIVPKEYVNHVTKALEDFGLKVNLSKSFWNGNFRESCGKEYYQGDDVSIVKLRSLFPTKRGHVSEIVSTVEFRNHLYKAGYWRAVRLLDEVIEKVIPFPALQETSSGLGKISFLGHSDQGRFDQHLQRPLVRAAVLDVRLPKSDISDLGDAALVKFFLKRSDLPTADRKHLEYAGRPVAVGIKHRWICPF